MRRKREEEAVELQRNDVFALRVAESLGQLRQRTEIQKMKGEVLKTSGVVPVQGIWHLGDECGPD